MRPGRALDHSPTSSAAVMEEEGYTSTHPLGHTGPVTGSLYLLLHAPVIFLPVTAVVTSPCLGRCFTGASKKRFSGVKWLLTY